MIDAFGSGIAVLTFTAIAYEHGSPTYCQTGLERHFDEIDQPHDGRNDEFMFLGMNNVVGFVNDFGIRIQDQQKRAPGGNNTKRLVTRIENKRPGHNQNLTIRSSW
jgi:hypothetical protein